MATPAAGTEQHFEIEGSSQISASSPSQIIRWLNSFVILMFHSTYILVVCVIGRQFLDSHDWKHTLPPQPPSPDGSNKNDVHSPDFIAVLLAVLIAIPGCWLVLVLPIRLDGFLQSHWNIWGVLLRGFGLMVNGLAAVAAAGAALHLHYEYINAVSMMGIYGVGAVILIGSLIAFGFGLWILKLILEHCRNGD